MNVNIFLLNSNPFFESYSQSDLLGKLIFIGLYFLSFLSWTVLIYKFYATRQSRKHSLQFYSAFQLQKFNPLNVEIDSLAKSRKSNPFLILYQGLKKQCLEVFAKNRHFAKNRSEGQDGSSESKSQPPSLSSSFLTLSDIDYLSAHLSSETAHQVKHLEKNLYLLSTTVSLAPFLGLLGTVWGILTTFSEMQSASGGSHEMVLSGLSMALATTVLGLVDAIPALIGYNYLKNTVRDFSIEMDGFSNEVLASIELQYRKVEH